MKSNNYSESDIQKYILEELSKEEQLKFEATMNENPEFAAEVSNYMKIAEGIEHFAAQNFKSRTKEIYSEVRPEIMSNLKENKSSVSWLKIILAAIVLLLLVLLLYKINEPAEVNSPQTIYAQYYKSYDWNSSLRNDESTIKLNEAIKLYSSKSYKEALPLIDELIQENPTNIQARLAIANCHLQSQNPNLAIPHLTYILGMDDVLYQDQANWYLAMAYLKMDQIKEAKNILTLLSVNESSDYSEDSKIILKDLK